MMNSKVSRQNVVLSLSSIFGGKHQVNWDMQFLYLTTGGHSTIKRHIGEGLLMRTGGWMGSF